MIRKWPLARLRGNWYEKGTFDALAIPFYRGLRVPKASFKNETLKFPSIIQPSQAIRSVSGVMVTAQSSFGS